MQKLWDRMGEDVIEPFLPNKLLRIDLEIVVSFVSKQGLSHHRLRPRI